MDQKEDVLVGAPTILSVQQYVEARAKELLSMSKAAINATGNNNQPLQKLPIHMRRRAASHNVKRLPKTLHNWAMREMAKAPPSIKKRPSRKYRRRPSNLLQEYRRRQRLFVWLETHIWHAKRFHMIDRWGYKIPHHPNDKGARAAYRATAKYCLLQDMSYHCCIELEGTEENILTALTRLCSPQTGLTFAAKVFRSGRREGKTVVYRHDKYPFSALGEVKFIWRYELGNCATSCKQPDLPTRHLWIWTHPAIYTDFISELRTVLGIHVCNDRMEIPNEKVTVCSSSSESDDENNMENSSKDEKETQIPIDTSLEKQESFSGNGVTVTSLKDTLCRFHLTGPLANDVLLESLKVATLRHKQTTQDQSHENTGEAVDERWWKSLFDTTLNTGKLRTEINRKQGAFWEKVGSTESPGELEPSCILGLTVRDPRVLLPPKKAMVRYDRKKERRKRVSETSALPGDVSWSPIWDLSVRSNVKVTKWPDGKINSKRSEALVPGSEVHLGDDESRVPVLLIQNPGRRPSLQDHSVSTDSNLLHKPGYCSGWDLIVPGGWGMPFLIALVHRGARIAGLKEVHTLAVEEGAQSFPNSYPDTAAGKEWEKSVWKVKQSKYDRVPPAKRCNFAKLGVAAPFHSPWLRLLLDWQTLTAKNSDVKLDPMLGLEDFYVLRSKTQLRKLQSLFAEKSAPSKTPGNIATPPAKKQKYDDCETAAELLFTGIPFTERCLVPVQIGTVCRGTPCPFSMICLPSAEDLDTFSKDRNWGGPKEPKHKTPKAKKVKRTVKQYDNPPELASVSVAGLRPIIGYIKEGSYSFAAGHGYGLGFVALLALRKILDKNCPTKGNKNPVLLRATTSSQYRLAYLSILAT